MNTVNFNFIMSGLIYWIEFIVFRSLTYLIHWGLALYYWNEGKTIPPIRNQLLLKSAKNLAEDIRNGKLKSKDVVQAYIDRIKEVEPYINAVVQDRFKESLEEAAKVDELIQSGIFSKQELEHDKPLFGVPITVKVMLKVKGCRCTAGSRVFEDLVAEEDAPTVRLLKNAGGIILATTNIPEFALCLETNNLIHGTTCNPYDTSRTPGGSSGGESALLASGASAVGIGNDIVGSLRVPAHFSGIYAHKASRGLVRNDGTVPDLQFGLGEYVSTGPLSRYPEDLTMMMKILTSENKTHLNFDRMVDFKKLKIYYFTSIDDPKSFPVDKEIVEGIHKAISYFTSSYCATAQQLEMPHINKTNNMGFHLIPAKLLNFTEYLTNGKVKNLNTFSELIKLFFGNSIFNKTTIVSVNALECPLYVKKKNIPHYQDIFQKLMEELDNLLDENSVIISPTFPTTAPYHNEMMLALSLSMCYTSLFNLTGMPVTVVPMGLNRNGMPQGMQISAKKNNDPLTIACASELVKVFGGWKPPGR